MVGSKKLTARSRIVLIASSSSLVYPMIVSGACQCVIAAQSMDSEGVYELEG